MTTNLITKLNIPKPLVHEKPMGRTWRMWKREFLIYMNLSGGIEKTASEKSYILQNFMGTVGIEALDNITFDSPNDREDVEVLLTKLDEYFDPPSNELEARYKFFTRQIGQNQDIEQFIDDLKTLSQSCRFGEDTKKMVIDRLIYNLDDHNRRLVFEFGDSVEWSHIVSAYKQMKIDVENLEQLAIDAKYLTLQRPNDIEVGPSKYCRRCGLYHGPEICSGLTHFCRLCKYSGHLEKQCRNIYRAEKAGEKVQAEKLKNWTSGMPNPTDLTCNKPFKKPCWRCGITHGLHECPAWKWICKTCNKRDHFTGRCRFDKRLHRSNEKSVNLSKVNEDPERDVRYQSKTSKCVWCGRNHVVSEMCPHDINCTACIMFPHDICYSCRTNPHSDSCKMRHVQLPKLNVDDICSWCDIFHVEGECIHKQSCQSCNEFFDVHMKKYNLLKKATNSSLPLCFLCNESPHSESCPISINARPSCSNDNSSPEQIEPKTVEYKKRNKISSPDGDAGYSINAVQHHVYRPTDNENHGCTRNSPQTQNSLLQANETTVKSTVSTFIRNYFFNSTKSSPSENDSSKKSSAPCHSSKN